MFLIFWIKWPPALILDIRNSLSIGFLAILDRYATLIFFEILTKWLPSAILYVRNSLPIAFVAILDQYGIFIFLEIFDKMAVVGHFGCPKFTFDRISGHFRSILNFIFLDIFTKWLPSAILDVRNSLSIAFLGILDQYGIFFFFGNLLQNGPGAHFGYPKFTFDRISGHFRSIHIFW